MLRFFRRIRQYLLSEGKFGKYIKYGVGEIILVVIGILIAVKINNVNIEYQNEEKEILYLTRLTTNLGSDVRLYEAIMAKDSLLINDLNKIKTNLTSYIKNIKKPIEDLDLLIKRYKFSANKTVIDNLISSGKIDLLRSNLLVERILAYYRQTDQIKSGIDSAITINNTEITNDLFLKFIPENINDENYTQVLKNYIDYRLLLINKQLDRYNSQRLLAEKLIDQINEEIELIETVY